MPKEVLLYGGIYSFSSSDFINQLNEALEENDDVTVRVNTEGGDPQYGWGIVAKIVESGAKVKIDGKAYSFGTFLPCYMEDVEALDVSEFMVHRAAYPSWYEKDPEFFTDEVRANLERINKNFEKALRNKIDVALFEEMKGVTIKDIFSMDSRIDVFLSAQEAKKIGLISTITKITPSKRKEIDTAMVAIAAKYNTPTIAAKEEQKQEIKNIMTLDELKSKHPDVYAQAKAEGVKAGKEEEKDRVSAWMNFADIDVEAVTKGIDEGRELKMKDMAEFNKKMLSAQALSKLESESPDEIETSEDDAEPKTATEKEIEDFAAKVEAELKRGVQA